eukprot:TRINITY_DN7731_c0_g1_i2.p1 TRINITY_DN7731_c0_g1~~TRINITY_DN7731_c0_g1_i2.p1  ORF type:complete len:395 (-),score=63.64 TRINITY_DN7731_c0_g1_i2:463-1647(-)
MGHICDYCGEQRSMVYCRSDAACLCLSCDRNVHSANALSRRHSRSLLCDRCNSQPAIVRHVEEKISLCQNCDWNAQSDTASGHKRQTINCYSGCPSAAEFSRIWSFVQDFSSIADSNCEQGFGLMSIDENSVSDCLNDQENSENINVWTGSSSMSLLNAIAMPCSVDQLAGSMDSTTPKLCSTGMKDLGICDDDDLYENFSVDDDDLNFENYEELFGVSRSEPLFEDSGIDSLFAPKNMSASDSHGQDDFVAEVKVIQPENVASTNSVMPNLCTKTESNPSFPARQEHSTISLTFSGLTGENSAGDYHDCGISSMLLMGEPPWYPPGSDNSLAMASRDSAVMRYKEKKKIRKFQKKIRYASRKARADVRRRVKGRFVKAGDAYDYDPMCQTRSC